jgi:hypothetical protein
MLFRFLADITVLLHLFWILFLIGGAVWGRRSRLVMVSHVLGLAFSLLLQLFGWYCPLTHLEFWFRQHCDPAVAYRGSFIAHYAEKLVYLDVEPGTVLAITVLLVIVNGFIYRRSLRKR